MQKRGLLVVTNPNNAEKTKELYVELAANHQTNSINEFITLEANKMTKAKYPPKKKEKIDVKKPMTKKQKKALEVIQQNPGITIAEIRKAMKIQTTEVNSLLLGLESHGVLLSEIDRHIAIMGKEPEYDPAYVSPRA
jgi:predicted HTH transcriptional regulator